MRRPVVSLSSCIGSVSQLQLGRLSALEIQALWRRFSSRVQLQFLVIVATCHFEGFNHAPRDGASHRLGHEIADRCSRQYVVLIDATLVEAAGYANNGSIFEA